MARKTKPKTVSVKAGIKRSIDGLCQRRGDMAAMMRAGIADTIAMIEAGELSAEAIEAGIDFERGINFILSAGPRAPIHFTTTPEMEAGLGLASGRLLGLVTPTDLIRYSAGRVAAGLYIDSRLGDATYTIGERRVSIRFRSVDDRLIDAVSHPSLSRAVATYTIQAVDRVRSGEWGASEVLDLRPKYGHAMRLQNRFVSVPASLMAEMEQLGADAGVTRADFARLAVRLMLRDLQVWAPPRRARSETAPVERAHHRAPTDLVIAYDRARYIELYAVTEADIITLDGAQLSEHNGDPASAIKILQRFGVLSWAAEAVKYPGDYLRAVSAVGRRVNGRRSEISVYRDFKAGLAVIIADGQAQRLRWLSEAQISEHILRLMQAGMGLSSDGAVDLTGYVKMSLRWSGEWI